MAFMGPAVADIYPVRNIDPHPHRFLVDPADHYAAVCDSDRQGWSIGGVYHSHPTGPSDPSDVDLAAPLDSQWISFVIADVGEGWRVRAFRIRNGRASELSLIEEAG